MKYKKKLIEVALPLEAINVASAREKSIRHGHPSTLHLWWARRPLAAARAVIFSQMVDDPSEHPDIFKTEKSQEKERQRLFGIIEELVKWESTTNEEVLQTARDEIWQSWRYTCAENADHPRAKELFRRDKLPAFHDPFAGGGAIPLEAQRLGLESYASDLNPVAVLINKAMIEIPPKFSAMPPINPASRVGQAHTGSWSGVQGLAEDMRFYGQAIKNAAEKQIGDLYPALVITADIVADRPELKKYAGRSLPVVAWIWARTVKSPNPAFSEIDVPLASTFVLSSKAGKEAYIDPVIEGKSYRFEVRSGKPTNLEKYKSGTKLARGANFKCLMSDAPMASDYIKSEGKAGRMSARLMAIMVEGDRERIFIAPTTEHENAAAIAKPEDYPDLTISGSTQYLGVKPYGMDRFDQLFSARQLRALITFSDLISNITDSVKRDALSAGLANDEISLQDGGSGALAYAEAVSVYLSFALDYAANYWSTLATPAEGFIRGTYSMQALPMSWDFAEAPPFGGTSGNWMGGIEWGAKALTGLPAHDAGHVSQSDAAQQDITSMKVVSTDPPYYDNVPYADLSDYFYIWLRRALKNIYPNLFSTVAVPKVDELVAFSYRHEDGKLGAEKFFLNGMTHAMHRISEQAHPAFPVTIYYAFKQAESSEEEGVTNTGWDTFLAAVIEAGFQISGTWPMRTERGARNRSIDSNALASSIILVCRKRGQDAQIVSRREFVSALKEELPVALAHLQAGNIAPVDLAQAAIGPGMAVYTRYQKVIDADGNGMSVRAALALINQTLDDALTEQEGDFDPDSRWALTWFEQNGFNDGEYGIAEQLSISKNTSVSGLVAAKIISSRAGKVRLLKPIEMDSNWDPRIDKRLTAWESVHQLIRALESGGESAAGALVIKLGGNAEICRELCYRLYILCERKKRANDAISYNGLVQSWPEIVRLSREISTAPKSGTQDLFGQE
ncbi:DUF1156 domain-containing protein [Polynucleobacter paneuropaeus]|nr:DUF1156 domain-containing protein [Polynucleobacter paneuropaeus]